jgi:hypothetical protein
MNNIKKAYVELHSLLEANANKKVSTIMPLLLELMSAKSGGGTVGNTFKKDEDGNVTHVFCYYHKEWEAVADVEYGSKKGTATGLNTMCKVGVSNWTKQQRMFKKSEDEVLAKILSGEITVDEAHALRAEAEEARGAIVPLN